MHSLGGEMIPVAERLLREVRYYLGLARDFERSGDCDPDLADAAGAVAANKLAAAIRVEEREA